MAIKAILAHDAKWGIGKNGDLPWPKKPGDLQWFKETTADGIVVMGRKTWESLPRKPLPNRLNLVISSNWMDHFNPKPHGIYGGKDVCKIVTDVIQSRYIGVEDIWIIGGAQLVKSCLPIIDELWLNNVGGDYECDVFLPKEEIMEQFYPKSARIVTFGAITVWEKYETVSQTT
jgi:dihydrofolate reductase